jgi:hypothetical protein
MIVSFPVSSIAGNEWNRELVIFGGGNTSAAVDTAELASPWFPVRGASRVVVRLWSANTSAWTAGDSTYSDSLTTFKVLLSDSLCCQVTDLNGVRSASAADSFQVDLAVTNPDTSTVGIGAKPLPISRPLAAAKSGSGVISVIYPTAPSLGAPDYTGVFGKQYMRIRTQALRRKTEGGRLSTSGKQTVGIRGLRGRVYVYYRNKQ